MKPSVQIVLILVALLVFAIVSRYQIVTTYDPMVKCHVIIRLDRWTGGTKVEEWP